MVWPDGTPTEQKAMGILAEGRPLSDNGQALDSHQPPKLPGRMGLDDSTRSAIRDEVQHSETAIVLKRWMIGVLIAILGQAAVSIWWAGRIDNTQEMLVEGQRSLNESVYTKQEATRAGEMYLRLQDQLAQRIDRNEKVIDRLRETVFIANGPQTKEAK